MSLVPAEHLPNYSYISTGLSVGGTDVTGSVIKGGYCKIGNLVLVNMRIAVTCAAGKTIKITGLPKPLLSSDNSVYISGCTNNPLIYDAVTMNADAGQINIRTTEARNNTAVILAFVYLCE